MISLTKLNGTSFYLNPHLILSIEEEHETYITLYDEGAHLVTVTESVPEIINKIIGYRKKLKHNAQEI